MPRKSGIDCLQKLGTGSFFSLSLCPFKVKEAKNNIEKSYPDIAFEKWLLSLFHDFECSFGLEVFVSECRDGERETEIAERNRERDKIRKRERERLGERTRK